MYTIGDISKELGLPISTIRFYDKQGLLPNLERKGNIRQFSQSDIELLKVIECLKNTGMPIKDIKDFCAWVKQGDASIKERQHMFHERKKIVEQQLEELNKTYETIKYKCWYYDTAVEAGTEDIHKKK